MPEPSTVIALPCPTEVDSFPTMSSAQMSAPVGEYLATNKSWSPPLLKMVLPKITKPLNAPVTYRLFDASVATASALTSTAPKPEAKPKSTARSARSSSRLEVECVRLLETTGSLGSEAIAAIIASNTSTMTEIA